MSRKCPHKCEKDNNSQSIVENEECRVPSYWVSRQHSVVVVHTIPSQEDCSGFESTTGHFYVEFPCCRQVYMASLWVF